MSKIWFFTPWGEDKNLGKAYNEYCTLVPEEDWICLMDGDAMFMTPGWGDQLQACIKRYPEVSLFGAVTNRVGLPYQCYGGKFSEETDIKKHGEIATELATKYPDFCIDCNRPIAGFLMLFKKKVWDEVKFSEGLLLSSNQFIDTEWSRRVLQAGYKAKIMSGVYMLHYYRFDRGKRNISHLINRDNLNVYQVYYNEETKRELLPDTIPYLNEELTVNFENEVIRKLYLEGGFRGNLTGLLSWKLKSKNRLRIENIREIIDHHDAYAFKVIKHDVRKDNKHPNFDEMFGELLEGIGLDRDIRPQKGFYQNAIVARPQIWNDYCKTLLLPAMEFLDNAKGAYREKLYKDPGYPAVINEGLKKLNLSHYTYHTFLLERLWSVYFHLHPEIEVKEIQK